jgi:hypothetical protein
MCRPIVLSEPEHRAMTASSARRWHLAWLVVAVSAIVGCGHTQEPDSETEARQIQADRIEQLKRERRQRELESYERAIEEKHRNRHLVQQREYERDRPGCENAIDDPSIPDERRHNCERWLAEEKDERRLKWQMSGVVCFDHRVTERLVEVSCDIPVPPNETPNFEVAFEKSQQLAAFAALSSGLTHTIVVGKDKVRGKVSTSTTPVECEVESSESFALRSFAWALMGGGTIETDCSTFGASTRCTTTPATPPPSPRMHCHGGTMVESVTSVRVTTQYEVLTTEEARLRDSPMLPPDRRALAAAPIARLFEGLR